MLSDAILDGTGCLHSRGCQGFGGSGEKGYLNSQSWGALIIILGEQAHTLAKKLRKNKSGIWRDQSILFWDQGSTGPPPPPPPSVVAFILSFIFSTTAHINQHYILQNNSINQEKKYLSHPGTIQVKLCLVVKRLRSCYQLK